MKRTFARYIPIRPFLKGRGMKAPLIVFTLLTLALSACGTTPTPELGTGVDEFGPYTVVAQAGDELSSQAYGNNYSTSRKIELRRYGTARYGAAYIIKEPYGTINYEGNVALSNYSISGHGPYNRSFRDFDRFSAKPTTMTLSLSPRTMRGPRVCAIADGLFRSDSGGMDGHERTQSVMQACKNTGGS